MQFRFNGFKTRHAVNIKQLYGCKTVHEYICSASAEEILGKSYLPQNIASAAAQVELYH